MAQRATVADVAAVLLREPDGRELRVRAACGLTPELAARWVVGFGRGVAGRIAARGAPMLVQDASTLADLPDILVEAWARSLAGAPIVADGHTVGAVVLAARDAILDWSSVAVAQLVAAAVGADLALREGRGAQVLVRLQRLQAASAALGESRSAAEVAAAVVGVAVAGLDATAGSVWLPTAGGGSLRVVGAVGDEVGQLERWGRIPSDAPLPVGECHRTGQEIVLRNAAERDDRYPALAGESVASAALVCVPLPMSDDRRGVLSLSFATSSAIDDAALDFLRALAEQGRQAVLRAELDEAERTAREAARRRQTRLAYLMEAGAMLARSTDVEATVGVLADLAVRNVADACAVAFVDAGRRRRGPMRPPATAAVDAEGLEAALATALATGASAEGSVAGVRWRAAPFLSAGELFGAVALVRHDPAPFGEADALLLDELGLRVGSALDREAKANRLTALAEDLERAAASVRGQRVDVAGLSVAPRWSRQVPPGGWTVVDELPAGGVVVAVGAADGNDGGPGDPVLAVASAAAAHGASRLATSADEVLAAVEHVASGAVAIALLRPGVGGWSVETAAGGGGSVGGARPPMVLEAGGAALEVRIAEWLDAPGH